MRDPRVAETGRTPHLFRARPVRGRSTHTEMKEPS